MTSERVNGSRRVVFDCVGPSMTEQHHANEVNINQIVSRYSKTGVLPPRSGMPRYGDFSGVSDYHTACEAVRAAESGFMTLAPEIRRRFENDPGKLLEFLADEKNYVEAVKLGLVVPPAADEPPIVAVEGSGEPVEAPSASSP